MISMSSSTIMKCFVIQPFDKGKYDTRFCDVFKPAIVKAGFEAYRVDEDPSIRIPIETIEKGISESYLCFAEITTDNPNVWYELGYAFACGKDVVMVCSDDRKGGFPFDIRHKQIIKYKVDSKSDFENLELEITKRLNAYKNTPKVAQRMPIQGTTDLEDCERAVLAILSENSITNQPMLFDDLKSIMKDSGFNNIGVAVRILSEKELIKISRESDWNNDSWEICTITEKGEKLAILNAEKLQRVKIIEDHNVPF